MNDYWINNVDNKSGKTIVVTIQEKRLATDKASINLSGELSNNQLKVELIKETLNSRSAILKDGDKVSFDRPNKTEFMTIKTSEGGSICENLEVKKNEEYQINKNVQVKSKGEVSSRSFNSLHDEYLHRTNKKSDNNCSVQ
jgi:hypothetical protein